MPVCCCDGDGEFGGTEKVNFVLLPQLLVLSAVSMPWTLWPSSSLISMEGMFWIIESSCWSDTSVGEIPDVSTSSQCPFRKLLKQAIKKYSILTLKSSFRILFSLKNLSFSIIERDMFINIKKNVFYISKRDLQLNNVSLITYMRDSRVSFREPKKVTNHLFLVNLVNFS